MVHEKIIFLLFMYIIIWQGEWHYKNKREYNNYKYITTIGLNHVYLYFYFFMYIFYFNQDYLYI
jgi:hypothetical protein